VDNANTAVGVLNGQSHPLNVALFQFQSGIADLVCVKPSGIELGIHHVRIRSLHSHLAVVSTFSFVVTNSL